MAADSVTFDLKVIKPPCCGLNVPHLFLFYFPTPVLQLDVCVCVQPSESEIRAKLICCTKPEKKKTVTTKNRSLKISYFVACLYQALIWSLIGINVADINTLDMG